MTGPTYTDSANFGSADNLLTAVGSVNAPANFAGTGTFSATGGRSVQANFGGTGTLGITPTLVKVTGAPATFGVDDTLVIAPVVKLSGATSFSGNGALTAIGSKILFRDSVVYDGANVVNDNFSFNLPTTLHDGDLGFVMISWPAVTGEPINAVADGWNAISPPTLSNGLVSTVLSRRYVAATDAGVPVSVALDGPRAITAAGGWWAGATGIDFVGPIGSRAGASSADTTAPGVQAVATAGETIALFFAEMSAAIGTSATLNKGTVRTMIEGSGTAQASVLVGDLLMPTFGISDDIIATYNTPSANGMGLQISLLPLGTANVGGLANFAPSSLQLSALGTDTTKNANFSSAGTLSAIGRVVSSAVFGVTGVLRATVVYFGTASLSGAGSLSTSGTPAVAASAAFGAVGVLSAVGAPSFATNTALSSSGTLATPGIPITVGIASLSTVAALSASVRPTLVQTASYSALGELVAPGTPQLADAADLGVAGLLTSAVAVAFIVQAALGVTGALSVAAVVHFSTPAALSGSGSLSAVGIPDFTPNTAVAFSVDGALTATGFRPQPPPAEITAQPYYIRQTQDWAIAQERQRHIQAIYQVGEPALFVMMWKVEDFEAALVSPCPRCRSTDDSLDARIAAVYQQPQTARCPFCFGTTFEGGIRAKIVRPAIFTDADEDERKNARGVTHGENLMVESTNDFRTRTGDYVFRRDGSRWQLGHPQRVMLRTGYSHPSQSADSLGYARIPAAREDASSVAFEIPPSREELSGILTEPLHFPVPTA